MEFRGSAARRFSNGVSTPARFIRRPLLLIQSSSTFLSSYRACFRRFTGIFSGVFSASSFEMSGFLSVVSLSSLPPPTVLLAALGLRLPWVPPPEPASPPDPPEPPEPPDFPPVQIRVYVLISQHLLYRILSTSVKKATEESSSIISFTRERLIKLKTLAILLLKLEDNLLIETVGIPVQDDDKGITRLTACVSSQEAFQEIFSDMKLLSRWRGR